MRAHDLAIGACMLPATLESCGNMFQDDGPDPRRTLAEAIRARREEIGMSQAELASRIKKSPATVSEIESAKRSVDMSLLATIASSLGTSVVLLGWAVEKARMSKNGELDQAINVIDNVLNALQASGAFRDAQFERRS